MAHVILRLPDVKRRVGLSRTSIYERVTARTFPAPVSLGGRCVGWLEHELQTWLESKAAFRDRSLKLLPAIAISRRPRTILTRPKKSRERRPLRHGGHQ